MKRISFIGLEDDQSASIASRIGLEVLANDLLPKIIVRDGQLFVSSPSTTGFFPVSKVVYHGIFEHDHDLIAGLALWGGPCLPNAHAMMDCRLKLPCLVRALRHTEYGTALRGFVSKDASFHTEVEQVAKWGNWHCGENKHRFCDEWTASEPSIIEPFFSGDAVRIVIIGEQAWQIQLAGDSWLKSIHHDDASFMRLDPDLHQDTKNIANAFGLEIMANDYIIDQEGMPHLLEVNHIPNVSRFPRIWSAFEDYVVQWCGR